MISQSCSFRAAIPKNRQPKVLVSLDLDGSLIGPSTQEATNVLNRLHGKGQIYTMVNTGNDLALLKHGLYGQRLGNLKVDCVSLSDGREVFLNSKAESQTAETWFDSIQPKDQDRHWQRQVGASGWDTEKVLTIIGKAVHNRNSKGAKFITDFHNTGFKGFLSDVNEQEVHQFITLVQQELKENGINTNARYSVKDNGGNPKFYVVFNPVGIHKAAPVNYLAENLNGLRGVVTLGDSDNDKEMLVTENFGSIPAIVPNYPILVGNFSPLVSLLKDKKYSLLTTGQEVHMALESQIKKALKHKKKGNGAMSASLSTGRHNPYFQKLKNFSFVCGKPSSLSMENGSSSGARDTVSLSRKSAVKFNYTQSLDEIKKLETVISELYKAAYEQVAPLFIGATDRVLQKASVQKDAKVLFLARDGIGGFNIAQQLLERFPERYPGLSKDSIHYIYLNSDTIHSPLMKDYLKQEANLNKNSSVFLFDIGWYGTLNQQFSRLFTGELGKYKGLHLTLAPSPYLQPYVSLQANRGPFSSISGNPAVHFLEDTFSGLQGRPTKLYKDFTGKIIPDLPRTQYLAEVSTKRSWGLKALADAGADISLQDLEAITPEKASKKLFDFLSRREKFMHLMVPHEQT